MLRLRKIIAPIYRALYSYLYFFHMKIVIYKNKGSRPYVKPFRMIDRFLKNKQVIFIHIPKAAGTSIAKLIYGADSFHHATLQEYYNENPGRVSASTVFTIVRNPYDRLWSAYHYLVREDKGKGSYLVDSIWNKLYLDGYRDFEDFVLHGLSSAVENGAVHFKRQADFIMIDGELAVKNIGRMESLDKFNADFLIEYSGEEKLTRINFNPEKADDKLKYYTPEMLSIVNELYYVDFVSFEYEICK